MKVIEYFCYEADALSWADGQTKGLHIVQLLLCLQNSLHKEYAHVTLKVILIDFIRVQKYFIVYFTFFYHSLYVLTSKNIIHNQTKKFFMFLEFEKLQPKGHGAE